MRIIGIDPGYATVGFGIIDSVKTKLTTVAYGAVTTRANTPFESRLLEIYDDITGILDSYKPNFAAIERLYFTTNQKTAIEVAHARGVIILAAKQRGLKIFEYTPLQVKQSVTGYGKAAKRQVQELTKRILNLSVLPKPDDAADALAIAICHAHNRRAMTNN
ncbi:MAG: crossover junction endodeoxyribonuclease RuvC [Oscillospiraceae bacterium]|nr:crossover junction endodeoxyribonuclease RuvC [Oscillospiraceae bacterium]